MKTTRLNIKRCTTFLRLACIVLALWGSALGVASGQSTIQGKVLDEEEQPYIGAVVTLNGAEAVVSNAEGDFAFDGVQGEDFCLKISALGYKELEHCGKCDSLSREMRFVLTPGLQDLKEVTVKGNVQEELNRTESLSIERVRKDFLEERQASSLMQTLSAVPGVNSMDVGTGISKPMIRGMSSYRVVVAENGIKQEGQQWSSHHGISIDQQAVEHVEVIKGPASLQYGSDAIGGVINVLPEPVPSKPGVSGEVSLVAKSNTDWLGGSAELSLRKGDVFSAVHLTYNSYGDFLIPETESFLSPSPSTAAEASHPVDLGNQLFNTAGQESGASLSAGVIKPWGKSYFEFSYYGTKLGFFDWQGIQNDSIREVHEQSSRDLQLPHQQVNNYAAKHFTTRYFGDDKLEVGVGYQVNNSEEFSNLSDRTGNRVDDLNYYRSLDNLNLGLFLHTLTGNASYTYKRIDRHTFKLGFNTQFQDHQTDGYNHILPDYNRSSVGGFLTHKFQVNEKWLLSSGVRLDYTSYRIAESLSPDVELGDSILNPAVDKTYPGSAFSLGLNYLPNARTIVKVNLGKSFRVPAVYELAAYGLHRHEARFEKGNVENDPEQAWQLDVGIERKWKTVALKLSPFLTYFTNYLYLNPSAELVPTGQVYEYRQTRAMLSGGEMSARVRLKDRIQFGMDAEYVYAVNLDLRSALPFTPPFSLRTNASYRFKSGKVLKESKVGVELLSVAAQNYTVPNELSTPGYHSVNLFAKSDLAVGKQRINVMLRVRNVLNASYYNHISFYRRLRIPEAGRDVQLFIAIPVN